MKTVTRGEPIPLACDGGHGQEHPHIIGEELFRGALVREQRRSDRSGGPFVLVLLGLTGGAKSNADSATFWDTALATVATTAEDGQIAGWIERRTLLGVIVPGDHASDPVCLREKIRDRLLGELTRHLHPALVARLSVRSHVYPEPRYQRDGVTAPRQPFPEPRASLRPPQRSGYHAIKRGLDVVVSLALLLLLTPALALIAALVKLGSRGPVLYRQERVGYRAKPFVMLKFRTMQSNTDPKIHQEFVSAFIKGDKVASGGGTNGFYKLTNDPRITPIGRLLRSTSLDELPQLWNVLRGDMSLVGPRPPLPYEYEQYAPWHRRRILDAKPGITGLWQVAGRSSTTFDEMVRLDLRYVRTRTIRTDLRILLATPAAVISGRGAC